MHKSNVEMAESYYLAMGEKNVSEVAQYVHPDVEFVGPLAQMRDKQAMIVYDLDCPSTIGHVCGASLMNIRNGLIEKIELIYDARPFEKKKEEIFQNHALPSR